MLIDRCIESCGFSGVDEHRHAKLACQFPQRIKPCVVIGTSAPLASTCPSPNDLLSYHAPRTHATAFADPLQLLSMPPFRWSAAGSSFTNKMKRSGYLSRNVVAKCSNTPGVPPRFTSFAMPAASIAWTRRSGVMDGERDSR